MYNIVKLHGNKSANKLYEAIQCITIWSEIIQNDMIQREMMQCEMMLCERIRYNTIQYNTIWYNMIRYDTIHFIVPLGKFFLGLVLLTDIIYMLEKNSILFYTSSRHWGTLAFTCSEVLLATWQTIVTVLALFWSAPTLQGNVLPFSS